MRPESGQIPPKGCAEGDRAAATDLLPLVYEELRRVARRQMSREVGEQTLQPTALVHEAYVRIAASQPERIWDSRWHFFAAAAEAMRRILVERARRRGSVKHGSGLHRVGLDALDRDADDDAERLLALDDALAAFAAVHPEKAQLVKLRYFAGLTAGEAAAVMGLSCSTVDRYWTFAKAWLLREMSP